MPKNKNYVAMLKRYARCHNLDLKYEDASEELEHKKRFFKRVLLGGQEYPFAVGNDEKEAKENAAKRALRCLEEKENCRPVTKDVLAPHHQAGLSNINDAGQKNKKSVRAVDSKRPEPQNADQNTELAACHGRYQIATRKRQQEAKKEAAMSVYCDTSGSDKTEVLRPGDSKAMGRQRPRETSASRKPPPARRPRRQLEVEFQEACQISDKDNTGISEMTTDQSKTLKFCSDFDSIVLLGKGAYGDVFKAKCKLTGMDFAVKLVSTKKMPKALEEVKALCKLSHRNIVGYRTCWLDSKYQYNSDSDSDSLSSSESSAESSSALYLYIQMELCARKTLRKWIDDRNQRLGSTFVLDSRRDREEALKIALDLVSGVKHIHSKSLIHRDLKPANVLFGLDGKDVKIGDFGLVTAMIDKDDEDAGNQMERSSDKGTPSYMAPEQKSEKYYDHKVDIFALGFIFFELFWNIPTCHERQEIRKNLRQQMIPQRFTDNFRVSNIIKGMLCERPDDRPEASMIKTALKDCCLTPRGRMSV